MAYKFNIGDRVVSIGGSNYADKVKGFHGTVRTYRSMTGVLRKDEGERTLVGVEWDEKLPFDCGHQLDKICECKPKRGWYVQQFALELEAPLTEDADLEVGVEDLI